MAKPRSLRLVVDANVMCASGQTDHPTSRRCREFLEAVRTICHRVVCSKDILEEWKEHESEFARKWRVAMISRRKILVVDPPPIGPLRKALEAEGMDINLARIALKDIHLIEAAKISDSIVVSLEISSKRVYQGLCKVVADLRDVSWVDPATTEDASELARRKELTHRKWLLCPKGGPGRKRQ